MAWTNVKPVPVIGKCLYAEAKGKVVEFPSMRAAARWLGGGKREVQLLQQISDCVNGRQRTAHMIEWRRKEK